MRIHLHIAIVATKISAALGECETSTTGLTADPLPFVRMFESELSMIQEKYASEWTPADEVAFLDARLSLYSYVLDQKKAEPLKNIHPENEIITQSCITAKQLLTVLTTFPDTLRKGTFHVFRAASYAVFLLLRIIGTAPIQIIDETAIRNTIRQAFTLMRDISQTANDRRNQCMRVCRIIENMVDYEDWDKDTPFLGKACSFMANNFIADVAARGMIKANLRHAAAQAEGEVATTIVAPEVEPHFDLDFSIWDSMQLNVNWQDSDDLVFLSENLGGSS
ncbi:hypothetical protein N7533_002106 [Penicillium manginii]|uniref:uncharacterized protein n=1 Tax=Penicillium manginii TaxID=203109 RepID=UPI002548CFB0|nr:uncharacterized protein N7533_002106 [Penicillium manginii]KAJ5763425.1 hypothetical protein N7533_002106 [Penicillium manginii]